MRRLAPYAGRAVLIYLVVAIVCVHLGILGDDLGRVLLWSYGAWIALRFMRPTLIRLIGRRGVADWGVVRYERRPIPSEVKRAVFARDGGRCVLCGSRYNLHYDHDIPVSKGGSNTVKNIRILCADCNLRKGARIE